MSKKNKKLALILILFAALLVWGFYEFKNKKKSAKEANNERLEENQQESRIGADSENIEEGDLQIARQKEATEYIAENIGNISPVAPVLGGKWHVNRFWTADTADGNNKMYVYAECEEGHIMRKFLIEADFGKNPASYEIKATFEPGEADWNLVQGKDLVFGKPLMLFEKNQNTGEWERK